MFAVVLLVLYSAPCCRLLSHERCSVCVDTYYWPRDSIQNHAMACVCIRGDVDSFPTCSALAQGPRACQEPEALNLYTWLTRVEPWVCSRGYRKMHPRLVGLRSGRPTKLGLEPRVTDAGSSQCPRKHSLRHPTD